MSFHTALYLVICIIMFKENYLGHCSAKNSQRQMLCPHSQRKTSPGSYTYEQPITFHTDLLMPLGEWLH